MTLAGPKPPETQIKAILCDERPLTGNEASIKGMVRPLDTSEALFAVFNAAGAFLTAQALEVHGPLTEALLVEAFTHLEKRHPLLGARIDYCGDKLYWVEGSATSPRVSVVSDVSAGLEGLTEIELHRPYAANIDRLWRCTWIPINTDRHWIILGLHHAVADGISGMLIVRDLLATCSALVGIGSLPPELPRGPTLDEVLKPVSPAALLRRRMRRLQSCLLRPPPLLPIERIAPPDQRRTSVIFGSLSGNVISAVRANARRSGTTINGVLAAALLDSVRHTLGVLAVVPVNYSCSMRGTAIPEDQLGCFVSHIVTVHSLCKSSSFWREAQIATAQLDRARRRRDAAAALLATRGKIASAARAMREAIEDRRTCGRVGAINIANRGRTTSFSAGPFTVAAWYPATSNHTFGNGVQVSCATVGGIFYFSLMHVVPLLSIASARRIKDRLLECLMGAAQAS
jgi:hypothetical protein